MHLISGKQQPESNAADNEISSPEAYEEIDDFVDIDMKNVSFQVAKSDKQVNDKQSYEDLSVGLPLEQRFYRPLETYETPLQQRV